MTTFQQLDALFERNNGILKTSQALQLVIEPSIHHSQLSASSEQMALRASRILIEPYSIKNLF